MSASMAFLALGLGQAIIYIVMRLFVKRTVVDRPSPLVRGIVVLIGLLAAALLAGAAYLAIFVERP